MSEVKVILCTFPDAVEARQIGTVLVEKQYAACVNLLPAVESIYRWNSSVCKETEVLAIMKSSAQQLSDLERVLIELHPHKVPEFIVLDPTHVSQSYAKWVIDSVH